MSLAEVDTHVAEAIAAMQTQADVQRVAFRAQPYPDLHTRIDWLRRLEAACLDRRDLLADAISDDYGSRSRHETMVAEVFLTVTAIRHMIKHVKGWMKPRSRSVALTFKPGRAKIVPQPLGVVGIIAPWNYPVQLALLPLATALAAGNRVLLKPSELTPNTSQALADMLFDTFPADLVSTVLGGPEVGAAFASLPLDHLLYTGSTRVGRLVMQAAASQLTPVTLELGGKSPAIVHRDFDVVRAANSIAASKLFNAGQTCIAPDYVLLNRGSVAPFVAAIQAKVSSSYPTLVDNPDYTAIINARHRARLAGYLDEARTRGAEVIEINPAGESFDAASPKLAPHLVLGATDDMAVLQDEIFGPILPIVVVDDHEQAIAYVNDHPRPLALYVFDDDSRRVDRLLERTHAGGVTVNDCLLHIAQDDLPFGGVGPSGMGAYHGRDGFETFSHRKSVFYQPRVNASSLLHAPYGRTIERLLAWLL